MRGGRIDAANGSLIAAVISGHWAVFGWTYGRSLPFLARAAVRAIVSFAIWHYLPDERFTLLPAAVAAIYLVTAAVLFIDSGAVARRLKASRR